MNQPNATPEVNAGRGWFGTMSQVKHYLRTVGADRDPEGNFYVTGIGVQSFMGIDEGDRTEVVIPSDCSYLSAGRECSLAAGLATTSYGMNVYVIA
jgi:hypothetical protein